MAFIQYELWKDCSFRCEYCYNQYVPNVRNKLSSLEYTIKSIGCKNIEPESSIGFIGGEFFGGQLNDHIVKAKFYELIGLTLEKIKTDPPGRLLIATALMAEDPSDWFEFCEFVSNHGMANQILVCTSWDAKYRFRGNQEQYWEETVRETQKKYPELHWHINMILTEYLLQNLLEDPEYLKKFQKKWNARVDFNIPYLPQYCEIFGETKVDFNKRFPEMLPKRDSFLKVLRLDVLDLNIIADHRFNSSEFHYALNDKDWIILPERDKMENTCTNLKVCQNCCGYADSDIKIQHDIKAYMKSFM